VDDFKFWVISSSIEGVCYYLYLSLSFSLLFFNYIHIYIYIYFLSVRKKTLLIQKSVNDVDDFDYFFDVQRLIAIVVVKGSESGTTKNSRISGKPRKRTALSAPFTYLRSQSLHLEFQLFVACYGILWVCYLLSHR